MALDYDFYIDTLGFNTAISAERPYERATAQFRKEQLDQSATVGDQSLTGWWTRGQLSFHKGAGIKYYEVLGADDGAIEGRFQSSLGVDPGEPGELSLALDFSNIEQAFGFVVRADVPEGGLSADSVPGYFILDANGDVFRYAPAGEVDPEISDTTAFYSDTTSITSDGTTAWRVDSTDGRAKKCVPTLGILEWIPPGSEEFEHIFFAKDRLFVVSTTGDWYQLSTAGGTATSGDMFWASGRTGDWSVADSPGALYVSNANTIFALLPDTDGLLPTLTAPSKAAVLPDGETIYSIFAYLGQLVICTSRGVRVAQVNGDATLVFGPTVIEGYFGTRQVVARGDLVYACGTTDPLASEVHLCSINLAEFVDSLLPAWASVRVVEGVGGAFTDASGNLAFVDDNGLWFGTGGLVAAGTLTTGLHRLGTLEPKAFRSLRVKTEGTDGDIDVTVNTSDGTTYTVGTVAAGGAEDFDLSTIEDFPPSVEYLSITFTLNKGAFEGPTLLGYQLKALPVPKRQRMIRVPLLLLDSEQNRTGQKMLKDPWDRLSALEALEESNAVVDFEDKVTGETGSAYIESIEVQRTASKQFGGFIWVTLRRL